MAERDIPHPASAPSPPQKDADVHHDSLFVDVLSLLDKKRLEVIL